MRERERDRQTDRQTERYRDRERETDRRTDYRVPPMSLNVHLIKLSGLHFTVLSCLRVPGWITDRTSPYSTHALLVTVKGDPMELYIAVSRDRKNRGPDGRVTKVVARDD